MPEIYEICKDLFCCFISYDDSFWKPAFVSTIYGTDLLLKYIYSVPKAPLNNMFSGMIDDLKPKLVIAYFEHLSPFRKIAGVTSMLFHLFFLRMLVKAGFISFQLIDA